MVGLKNGHICTNLTQNGEPQRSSWGTQKKKKVSGQTVGGCVDNTSSLKVCAMHASLFINQSASASSSCFIAVQTQYSTMFDNVEASLPQLVHMNHSNLSWFNLSWFNLQLNHLRNLWDVRLENGRPGCNFRFLCGSSSVEWFSQ